MLLLWNWAVFRRERRGVWRFLLLWTPIACRWPGSCFSHSKRSRKRFLMFPFPLCFHSLAKSMRTSVRPLSTSRSSQFLSIYIFCIYFLFYFLLFLYKGQNERRCSWYYHVGFILLIQWIIYYCLTVHLIFNLLWMWVCVYSVEYNVSYVYHALYAYFDRDNIALRGLAK